MAVALPVAAASVAQAAVQLAKPLATRQSWRILRALGREGGPVTSLPEAAYRRELARAILALDLPAQPGVDLGRDTRLRLPPEDLRTIVITELERQAPSLYGPGPGDPRFLAHLAMGTGGDVYVARPMQIAKATAQLIEEVEVRNMAHALDAHDAQDLAHEIGGDFVRVRWLIEKLRLRQAHPDRMSWAPNDPRYEPAFWEDLLEAAYELARRQLIRFDFQIQRVAERDPTLAQHLASEVAEILWSFGDSSRGDLEVVERLTNGLPARLELRDLASRAPEDAFERAYDRRAPAISDWARRAAFVGWILGAQYAPFSPELIVNLAVRTGAWPASYWFEQVSRFLWAREDAPNENPTPIARRPIVWLGRHVDRIRNFFRAWKQSRADGIIEGERGGSLLATIEERGVARALSSASPLAAQASGLTCRAFATP